MSKSLITIFLLLTILFVSEQTFALKCGNKLVDVGDYKYKVYAICGEPDFSEIRTIKFPSQCRGREYYGSDSRYYRNDYRYRDDYYPRFTNCQYKTVDIWIYNFGPRKFMREVIFLEGIVKEINTLDYGYL